MNTRYFLAPDSVCSSVSTVSFSSILPASVGDRIAANSNARPSRNSPPPFLIRLAMRISRARWYSFLRRVFHYQNGSGSGLGPNPFDSWNWMLMEFIALVVQISFTAYTLFMSREERPVWPMRIWVSGYALGCFLSLIVLFWRYRFVFPTHGDVNSNVSDIEQQRSHEESRNMQYMQKLRTSLELIFAIWFVMGNVWVFDSRFGSYRRAPKLHVLCISLLAWNAVSYSFPFILFVLLCCCVPLVGSLLGYNMNMASLDRGATDEQLASLPSWKYKDFANSLELGNSAKSHEIPLLEIQRQKKKQPDLVTKSIRSGAASGKIPISPAKMQGHTLAEKQFPAIFMFPCNTARLEEMESRNKPRKFRGPRLDIVEIKKQSVGVSNVPSPAQAVASPGKGGGVKPRRSTSFHCLCSPTTHAGSFRCRHHRNVGPSQATC
ncbi:hypothetical protein BUALT_Bualt03G0103000 [Buddleja alternifolia]|uniref:Uncharacterized protein n=1 Tax=Buddleja alternifolia TaxID=168488 RepID=A0AAV6Y3U8_9LAMI|nr:hypothetical protein BUALT_Bualt03G0103000 [Buddleja alternifolia]